MTNQLEASKEDLKEELLRIKTKARKSAEENKAKSQKVVESAATVGVAYLISDHLGKKAKEVRKATPEFDTLSAEEQTKKLADAQGVMGLDIDLVIGVVGVGIGFTELAGEYSGIFNSGGLGALASFASRSAYQKALHAVDEEETV